MESGVSVETEQTRNHREKKIRRILKYTGILSLEFQDIANSGSKKIKLVRDLPVTRVSLVPTHFSSLLFHFLCVCVWLETLFLISNYYFIVWSLANRWIKKIELYSIVYIITKENIDFSTLFLYIGKVDLSLACKTYWEKKVYV